MAKRYFVRYFIKTPNSIGSRQEIESGKAFAWKFNFGDTEISLYDHKQGLFADFYIYAESFNYAEKKSKTFIENILNLIDFSTSSASSLVLLISGYDASKGLLEREYKQVFYVPIRERNVNVINKKIFSEIFDIFGKNEDERIVRAVSWLRKGYFEQKPIDKFIAFWTSLESLNELLCDFFKISTENRKIKCNKCGNVVFNISSIGIKKLFIDEANIDKELFEKIRGARGKLLHGGGPLNDNFVNEIKLCIPLTRKALITGIGKLLQMSDESIEDIVQQKPKMYKEKIRIILKANLLNFTPPKLKRIGKQPRVDLVDTDLLERIVDRQGKLNIKSRTKFKFNNATFDKIALELWGEENTCITRAQISEIEKTT